MESDEDSVGADEFYSTLTAHNEADTSSSSQRHLETLNDDISRQDLQLHKHRVVRPSKNPTHDKKYHGHKISRKKLNDQDTAFGFDSTGLNNNHVYSDCDSEVSVDKNDSLAVLDVDSSFNDEGDDSSDDSEDATEDLNPTKKRKVEIDMHQKHALADDDDDHDDDDVDSESSNKESDWEDVEEEDDYEYDDDEEDNVDKHGIMNQSKNENSTKSSGSIIFSSDPAAHSTVSDIQRGIALQKQLQLWEKFFQLRVLMQKALQASNEINPECVKNASQQPEEELYCKVVEKLRVVMGKMLIVLMKCSRALPNLKILPDESFGEDVETEESLSDIGKHLMTEGPKLMQFWNDKIQISLGRHIDSNSTFSKNKNSVASQIENILADRQRLLKRTRTKRVEYNWVDKVQKEVKDENVYDEYDFYQALLKDLISNRSCAVGQHKCRLQASDSLKLKSVKSITTQLVRKQKAIVYDIHAKLVGFMAPKYLASDWSDEAIDSLTLSVFNG